ncbi:hypothetical protein GCM10010243_31180 [Streptomyces matensis]|nr:hypothetical protein GCM10010243_31180 [Streptomyces matensis]
MKRLLSTTLATVALAAGIVINTSSPAAAAEMPAGCSSVVQIGSTRYITVAGASVASVKQFKGCGKNWAYAYVWQSFRDAHRSWHITTWIRTDRNLGTRTSQGVEVWSDGTNTLNVCTQASAQLSFNLGTFYGITDTRC